jgi:hypothetical protein
MTYDGIWASVGVNIRANLPSLHAQRTLTWLNQYVVSFLLQPSYIDLNQLVDTFSTGDTTMLQQPPLAGPGGSFTVTMWALFPSANPGFNGKLFSCSSGSSSADEIYFGLASNFRLQYGFRVNGVTTCTGIFGTTSSIVMDQWTSIAWMLLPDGSVSAYVNGQVLSGTAVCASANMPPAIVRAGCVAGMSSYSATNQSTASISRYAFFPRNLAAVEVYTIALNPPPALNPATLAVVGLPQLVTDGYTIPTIQVKPNLCTGEQVTFAMALTSVGQAGNPYVNATAVSVTATLQRVRPLLCLF